ncbi:MAG: SOS response-associated peptidase [Candidatus Levybacteria bacterium]|nr:SOS response-associated peptidase [Candidatus Levybacteria bacterium]
MCGRYGLNKTNKLKARYGLDADIEDYEGSYNIAPSQKAVVISEEDPKKAQLLAFGIGAPWDDKHLLINAQSETVDEKRTFKKLFEERRCLIPADFFFEWKRTQEGKQPYAFSLKNDETFSFAGIHNDEGFVILTGTAGDVMKEIHDREPIILRQEDEASWLDPDMDIDRLKEYITPRSSENLKRWKVSPLINSPKNNDKQLINEV